MSETQAVQVSALSSIRTDAKIPGLAQWPCFPGPELDLEDTEDSNTANWNDALFSFAVGVVESTLEQTLLWGTTFAEFIETAWPKSRKPMTACMYRGAIADMGIDIIIEVYNVVKSEFCIGFRDGNRIFEEIRDTISQGNRAVVSFKNIRSLSAAFLESAIGQLYKSEIPEAKLEKCITWEDVSPTRKLLIERAIAEAKKSKVAS